MEGNVSAGSSYMWAGEAPYLCIFYLLQVFFLFTCYILLVVTVVKTPRFCTPGYAILISMLTAEAMVNINWHVGGTLPVILHYQGLLTYTYHVGLIMGFNHYLFYSASSLHLMFITFQRYYSVAYFASYKRIFNWKNTIICMVVFWIAAVAFSMPCSVGPCKFYFSVDYLSMLYDYSYPFTHTWTLAHSFGYNFASTAVILLFCGMFLYKLRQVRKSSSIGAAGSSSQQSAAMNEELRLSIPLIIIAGWWAFVIVFWAVVSAVVTKLQLPIGTMKVVWGMQTAVAIWMFGLDSILILVMNRDLRSRAREILCSRQPSPTNHTSAAVAGKSTSVSKGTTGPTANIPVSRRDKKSVPNTPVSRRDKKSVPNAQASKADNKSVPNTPLKSVDKKSVPNTPVRRGDKKSAPNTPVRRGDKKSVIGATSWKGAVDKVNAVGALEANQGFDIEADAEGKKLDNGGIWEG